MKRVLDILISAIILCVFSPVLVLGTLMVFLEDRRNPIYSAARIGKSGKRFYMFKIRSMRVDADSSGVESTGENDPRITNIGKYIRKLKVDELSQFVNVLLGDMSIVGPRPNTAGEVGKYSDEERHLLSLKPGITDFSSIVFANEGEILKFSQDPDKDYDELIRPWKSELGLLYVKHSSTLIDLLIITATAVSLVNRAASLRLVSTIIRQLSARSEVVRFSARGLSDSHASR